MRIAFTGPESSGKTTFSKWLSLELSDSLYVPEFAREYLEEKNITRASEDDFKSIVAKQCALFNERKLNVLEIFDTDIFVLRIWNQEVYQLELTELEILPTYKMDIHFLCAPDVEWKEDALRSAPDHGYRNSLFLKYKNELMHHQTRLVILYGSLERKKELILQSVREFISNSQK
jgi:nicotinamide riboside kinase